MVDTALRPLVIWGASGQAKVLAEFVRSAGFRPVAFFDNSPSIQRSPVDGVPLSGGDQAFLQWVREKVIVDLWGIVAIGGNRGATRLEIQARFTERGMNIATLIHPRAFVAASATVGAGSQVLVHATICADARLGDACIVNTASSIDHECQLGDGVHVGPGAHLAGCVEVGDCAFVGTGAIVLPRLRIGHRAIVGAGAVVTKNVPDDAVVFGNPARMATVEERKN